MSNAVCATGMVDDRGMSQRGSTHDIGEIFVLDCLALAMSTTSESLA